MNVGKRDKIYGERLPAKENIERTFTREQQRKFQHLLWGAKIL